MESSSTAGIEKATRRTAFRRGLFSAAAGVILLSGCLVAVALAYLRTQAIESGERLTDSFAQVIEEQTTRTFQSVNQSFQLAAISLTQMQAAGTLNEQSGRGLLRQGLANMPFARVMWVTDAQGRLVYNSEPEYLGASLADTAYFKFLQAQPQTAFHVAAPVKSRFDGQWLIPAGSALLAANGAFAGTIAASIDPLYFSTLWKSIELGANGSVSLFRSDGVLLTRSPFDASAVGKSFPAFPVFSDMLPKNSAGRVRLVSGIDGHDRIFSYRRLSAQPELVIVVGQSFDQVLAPWQNLALLALAIWSLGSVGIVALCFALDRVWQRRFESEARLHQSEENLAITMQSIGDGVIATDPMGRITRMNAVAGQLTGWPINEAIGKPLTEVFRIVNTQKSRAPAIDPVDRVMQSGEVVKLQNHTALLARDGTEYQISESAAPIRDATGKIAGVVLVFSDHTEDYQMRAELAKSADVLRRTGEMARVGAWETDVQTGDGLWSEQICRILEVDPPVTPATVLQRQHFFAPEAVPVAMAAAKAATDHATPWDLDLPMITAKGRHIWVRSQGFPQVEGGKVVKVNGTIQDITDRKKAEAAYRESLALFRSSFNSAGIGMTVSGLDGRWLQVNQRFCEIVGYAEPQLLQMAHQNISHPDDDAANQANMERLIKGDVGYFQMEKRYFHSDGHIVWINLTVSLVCDASGKPTHTVAHLEDISSRKQLEHALRQSERDLREGAQHTQTILDNMADCVVTIDGQGLVESFNKAASTVFGYAPEEIIGRNVSLLMAEPHGAFHESYLRQYAQTGQSRIIGVPRELEAERKDGTRFPISVTISKISHLDKVTFIGLMRDITEHQKDLEEIRRLAFFDPLTGLPNRRLLLDRLRQAMVTSTRNGQHGALMFLDLDHFKVLNDTLGHDVGDVLLQQVAARLLACVREGDSVARLGGDEFVILLEALSPHDHEAATQAEIVASKIREAFHGTFNPLGHAYDCTPSIGIVVLAGDEESTDELLKKADVAMYQAKAAGRNAVRFFDPAMQAAVAAHDALAKDMRRGLKLDEFVLHYQIQVDRSGAASGVEALVRWNHPKEGVLAPSRFISLAEETGLILPLGQSLLETACAQLASWANDSKKKQWAMSVNVSASQFAQADFVRNVDLALQKSGANPKLLKLELTESMLLVEIDNVIEKMNVIRSRGVGFSLDDFGTGYSSLSYLKRLPLDNLKIDQSFVRDVLTDPIDAVIARTIVALGNSLGMNVIAEGVENEAQQEFLLEMGCHAFQGYLFGRAVPAADLDRW